MFTTRFWSQSYLEWTIQLGSSGNLWNQNTYHETQWRSSSFKKRSFPIFPSVFFRIVIWIFSSIFTRIQRWWMVSCMEILTMIAIVLKSIVFSLGYSLVMPKIFPSIIRRTIAMQWKQEQDDGRWKSSFIPVIQFRWLLQNIGWLFTRQYTLLHLRSIVLLLSNIANVTSNTLYRRIM